MSLSLLPPVEVTWLKFLRLNEPHIGIHWDGLPCFNIKLTNGDLDPVLVCVLMADRLGSEYLVSRC